MKVLKKGQPQKGWSIEAHCSGNGNGNGGCGAKLLVEQADLFKTHSYVRDEHDVYITFKCSECGVLNDLPSGKEPPSSITVGLPDQTKWVDPGSKKAKDKKVNEAKKLLEGEGFEVRKVPDSELYQEMMGS